MNTIWIVSIRANGMNDFLYACADETTATRKALSYSLAFNVPMADFRINEEEVHNG